MCFLVVVVVLLQVFVLVILYDKVMEVVFEVVFFQVVKVRLNKFIENLDGLEEEYNDSFEVWVKQIIDQVLVIDKVVDIFDVVGI